MNSAEPVPAPRRRPRKLRLAWLAPGGVVALLALVFLLSGSGPRESVEIHLLRVTTNAENNRVAWFSISNAGSRAVHIMEFATITEVPPYRPPYHRARLDHDILEPGESFQADLFIPPAGPVCRGEVVWMVKQTRIKEFQLKLRNRVEWALYKINPRRGPPAGREWKTRYSEEVKH